LESVPPADRRAPAAEAEVEAAFQHAFGFIDADNKCISRRNEGEVAVAEVVVVVLDER
jgi:hypothetical protein